METKKETSELLPFGSLHLKKSTLSALEKEDFLYLSPIQQAVIPKLLKDKNVLALAPTGTGKTLSYVVPILDGLSEDALCQAIVLSPTVALLDQIADVFLSLLPEAGFRKEDVKVIRSKKDFTLSKPKIVLSTPAMYGEILSRYDTSKLRYVIIDEGDMVFFDGFGDSLSLLKKAVEKGLVSFFSASLGVQEITRVRKTFHLSETIDLRQGITADSVKHHMVLAKGKNREEALLLFLKVHDPYKAILFVSKKEDLAPIGKMLKENQVPFLAIAGDSDKRDIRKTIDLFKERKTGLLLATDYVARGIDVKDCREVVSIDLPNKSDYYFHRAGRTGRFLSEGDSYILLYEDEKNTSRARDLVRRGLVFDYLNLSEKGIKEQKGPYQFKNLGKKDQSNEKLQKQIRHAVNKTQSKKVKPNYRKKVSKAVDLVKLKHRKKVVLTNIAKKGGNARDFHSEAFEPKRTNRKK